MKDKPSVPVLKHLNNIETEELRKVSASLYSDLMKLVEENGDCFYFKDYGNHRVFDYRLANYSQWILPSALEARGITFYMKEGQDPILVCRPFKKFFNLDENPLAMNLDLTTLVKAGVKEDGSLIMSYVDRDDDKVKFKSKVALNSEQAVMATQLIHTEEHHDLLFVTDIITRCGGTVMFELVSPANRIVLEYEKTELRLIGIRDIIYGQIVDYRAFSNGFYPTAFDALQKYWVNEQYVNKDDPDPLTAKQLLDQMPTATGIEGYVLTLASGQMIKIKTDWYRALHHLRDSVDTAGKLFEAIIDERVDDVRAMFKTDQFTQDRISEMESRVLPIYNTFVANVEKYYNENKHLDRKSYAIGGQKELAHGFNIAMNLYLDKEPGYKDYAKKHREDLFGIVNGDTPSAQE